MIGRSKPSGFSVEGAKVVHVGAVVSTEILSVRTPEGATVERQVVRHPGAVAVVAVHNASVVFMRQYRAALDCDLLEIPAGKLDVDGEPPAEAARRELIEEAGLDPGDAGNLVELGRFFTAAGFCDEEIIIFGATNCVEVNRSVDGPEEAHSEVVFVPIRDAQTLAAEAKLSDAKTLVGLLWANHQGMLDSGTNRG